MTAHDALTSETSLRRVLILTAGLLVASGVAFVGIRLYEGIQIQHAVAAADQRVTSLEAKVKKLEEGHEDRISMIETFLYGEVTTELKSISAENDTHVKVTDTRRRALDAWLLRRDTETRDRLKQLEMWRLSGRP